MHRPSVDPVIVARGQIDRRVRSIDEALSHLRIDDEIRQAIIQALGLDQLAVVRDAAGCHHTIARRDHRGFVGVDRANPRPQLAREEIAEGAVVGKLELGLTEIRAHCARKRAVAKPTKCGWHLRAGRGADQRCPSRERRCCSGSWLAEFHAVNSAGSGVVRAVHSPLVLKILPGVPPSYKLGPPASSRNTAGTLPGPGEGGRDRPRPRSCRRSTHRRDRSRTHLPSSRRRGPC